jgi:hypothetical protein
MKMNKTRETYVTKSGYAGVGRIIKRKDNKGDFLAFNDDVEVLVDGNVVGQEGKATIANLLKPTETNEKVKFEAKIGDKTIGKVLTLTNGTTFQFENSVEIKIKGKAYKMRDKKYANLVKPSDKTERLIELGFVKEQDIEKRREAAKNAEASIRYELDLVPPKK